MIEELKPKARKAGPVEPVPAATAQARRRGLTNLEYAPLCEIMGRVPWAPRGVQLLGARHRQHGDASSATARDEHKKQWLEPLLDGKIRSRLRDDRAGGGLVRRHQHRRRASSATATSTSSTAASGGPRGAGDPRCKIFIFMGKTDPDAPRHSQQSMILVPADTPGINDPAAAAGVRLRRRAARPHGDRRSRTCACRPRNMLLGEGRGFEIAQGRLGPGRIHHCMRLIGLAERALELMCKRALAARRVRQARSPSRA